jgi:CyaY protein
MATAITEREFEIAADAELLRLEKALAEVGDIEIELSLGVLTIEFADGAKYVINSHRAAKQIWMAAERTAWHFDPTEDRWVASRTNEELWQTVSATLSKKLGRATTLNA